MSVLINMEMPTNCLSCPLQGGTADCRLTQKTYNWGLTERPSDCPLIPVPPHGRLIDADALAENHRELAYELRGANYDFHMIARLWVNSAPTIIPASEEGET